MGVMTVAWIHGPAPAGAYTGGPVRATIEGFDRLGNKIFFTTKAYDESGEPARVFYFALAGPDPTHPVRAATLEQPDSTAYSEIPVKKWSDLKHRLTPLQAQRDFRLIADVTSDSTGTAKEYRPTRFAIHARLRAGSLSRKLELVGYCQPLFRVQGLYRVPGREERLAVVSVIGRAYGCEEVELPVLLTRRTSEADPAADSLGPGTNPAK